MDPRSPKPIPELAEELWKSLGIDLTPRAETEQQAKPQQSPAGHLQRLRAWWSSMFGR